MPTVYNNAVLLHVKTMDAELSAGVPTMAVFLAVEQKLLPVTITEYGPTGRSVRFWVLSPLLQKKSNGGVPTSPSKVIDPLADPQVVAVGVKVNCGTMVSITI